MEEHAPETEAEKALRRRGLPRSFKRALLSGLILLLLIVAAGVVYVWFTGGQAAVPAKTVAPASDDTTAVIKPSVPGPNVPESVAVETITSPVSPGSNVTLNARTLPRSQCSISVTYGSVTSKDSGLSPKQASEYGIVSWTWTVESGAPTGNWPVHVTCSYNGKTAVVDATLAVTSAPAGD